MTPEQVAKAVIRMVDEMWEYIDQEDQDGASRWNMAIQAFTKAERDKGDNPGLRYSAEIALARMERAQKEAQS